MLDVRHTPGGHGHEQQSHAGGGSVSSGGSTFAGVAGPGDSGRFPGRWAKLTDKSDRKVASRHAELWRMSGGLKVKPDDVEGISVYTADGYEPINHTLRGKKGKINHEDYDMEITPYEAIEKLDSVFAKTALAKNTMVYRGVSPATYEKVKQNIGGEFHDKGFVSTSSSKEYASTWKAGSSGIKPSEAARYMLPVIIRAGAKAIPVAHISENDYEEEVLIARNQKFKVKQSRKGRLFLELAAAVAKEALRHTPGGHGHEQQSHAGGGKSSGGKWKSLNGPDLDSIVTKHDKIWKASGGNRVKGDAVGWLRSYTQPDGYFDINKSLRSGKPPVDRRDRDYVEKAIKNMDQAFSNANLSTKTVVYRAVKPSVLNAIKKNVGGEFVDKAFVSTTSDKSYAKQFALNTLNVATPVILPIVLREGAKALPLAAISSEPAEKEVLIDRGAKFNVRQSKKGRIFLELAGHVAKAVVKEALRDNPFSPRLMFLLALQQRGLSIKD